MHGLQMWCMPHCSRRQLLLHADGLLLHHALRLLDALHQLGHVAERVAAAALRSSSTKTQSAGMQPGYTYPGRARAQAGAELRRGTTPHLVTTAEQRLDLHRAPAGGCSPAMHAWTGVELVLWSDAGTQDTYLGAGARRCAHRREPEMNLQASDMVNGGAAQVRG